MSKLEKTVLILTCFAVMVVIIAMALVWHDMSNVPW